MEICYKFGKAKSYPRNFWDATVKNGCGYLGHGTLDLAASKKWVDGINWFLHVVTDLGKLKVISIIFGWEGWEMGVVT